MNSLKNKTALITGVSRRKGIGFAVAKMFAEAGCNLFLHSFSSYDKIIHSDIKKSELELIKKELSQFGKKIVQKEVDFEKPDSEKILMNSVLKTFSQIDILVLNHTYNSMKEFENLTSNEIEKHLNINVRSSLMLAFEFVKQFKKKSGGRVIILTSGQHLGPMPHLAYVACKGALHHLTTSLSDLLMEKGITVNAVNPGPTKTYITKKNEDLKLLKKMPLGRWGRPKDAARLITWLASKDAKWITGQVLNSEGGFRRK